MPSNALILVGDKDEAVELLTAVLPDVDAKELRDKLGSRRGFVWVKRGITPKERAEVFRLGLPGVGFLPEHKRVYPNGPVAAHVLGFTNIDTIAQKLSVGFSTVLRFLAQRVVDFGQLAVAFMVTWRDAVSHFFPPARRRSSVKTDWQPNTDAP